MKEEKATKKETIVMSGNEKRKLRFYWLLVLFGTLAVSVYPIYMGIKVVRHMMLYGEVHRADFPKYIIPYTPIAIAVIAAVVLMPVLFSKLRRFALPAASGFSLAVFFVTELLLESKVIVTATVRTTLESWQMYMCYVVPDRYVTRKWRAVDVLIGEYSPTFKIHFYLISLVLILAIINCLYGFGQMILKGNREKQKALVIQAICTGLFLGLCILACFTAFYRDGELTVSLVSACLMGAFFILLGIMVGTYAGSFLLGKKKSVAVLVPAVAGGLTTLLMYMGELFLLSGNLYRFGNGFLCTGLPGIVLAPLDVFIVLLAGAGSGGIGLLINIEIKGEEPETQSNKGLLH